MEYRQFGKTELTISVIGLGCSRLGKSFLADNSSQAPYILEKALELGINYFDLANVNGFGQLEALVGKSLKSNRKNILLGTKGGKRHTKYSRLANRFIFLAPLVRPYIYKVGKKVQSQTSKNTCFDPAYLKKELTLSLERLQTDYLDFYQLHSPPLEDLQNTKLFKWLYEEKKSGRIRYFGVSVRGIKDALWVTKNENVDGFQLPYNLLDQTASEELFPTIKRNEYGIIARVPFARGKIINSSSYPEIANRMKPHIENAAEENLTISQYAIKKIIDSPFVSTIIPGTSNINHLIENTLIGHKTFTR